MLLFINFGQFKTPSLPNKMKSSLQIPTEKIPVAAYGINPAAD